MFLLVPSPLLSAATWRPAETWLREQGHDVQVVDFGSQRRTPALVLAAVVAAAADREVFLVPHSNAGLYAPQLAELVDIRATVFADAALPDPAAEGKETPLAPSAFFDFLQTLADDDGILPPWTTWWGDVAGMFPDSTVRHAVEGEQQRLPLTYFTSRVPVPTGWTRRQTAYLAFGNTYAEERDRAIRMGWPTKTVTGGHLHMLHDPAEVGSAILHLSRLVSP